MVPIKFQTIFYKFQYFHYIFQNIVHANSRAKIIYQYKTNIKYNQQGTNLMEHDCQIFKRRLSLIQQPTKDKILSQRQHLRNKYYEYMRRSHNGRDIEKSVSPCSDEKVETHCSSKFDGDVSMPSIRQLRQHRHQVGEMLRKTLCRYNYAKHQQQKNEQFLQRKKKKYQKVLKIRQQNLKEKMELTRSRAFNERQISEEKFRLKRSVDLQKLTLGQSMVRCLHEKKAMGDTVRSQIKVNKSKIQSQKNEVFRSKKQLHNTIRSEEKKFKAVMGKIYEQKKRNVTEHNLNRFQRQIDLMKSLDSKNKKANLRLTCQIKQLEKSKKMFEKKMKSYSELLQDGPSIRKRNQLKFTKKINFNMNSLNQEDYEEHSSVSLNRYTVDASFQQ